MKLAFAVVTPDVSTPEVCAYRGPLGGIFARLAELGYDGVELMVRDPLEIDLPELDKPLEQFKLEVPCVTTGEIYACDRLTFMDPDESVRQGAQDRMRDVIDFAQRVHSPNVNIGRFRGSFSADVSHEQSLEWAVSGFRRCADYAADRDVWLVLEPINFLQCDNINTTQEGLKFVARVDHPNFALMLDLFHMHVEDRSIIASIAEAAKITRHVHVCDSNRQAPGRGALHFDVVLRTLSVVGYKGYLSGEMLMIPDQDTAAATTAEVIRPLLKNEE